LIKIIILGENFKWHLEAFASELFIFYIVALYYKFQNELEAIYLCNE